MPNASTAFTDYPPRSPELEPALQGAMDTDKRKTGDPGRFLVRITSVRKRLIDPDNLVPKYFIDCCKYAGLIPDDTAEKVEIVCRQRKVQTGEEAHTLVEIIPL